MQRDLGGHRAVDARRGSDGALPSMLRRWAAAAGALALAGCVLPIPNTKVVAPSISGRVVHANTGAPIDMAGVVVEDHKEASVITGRDGAFRTDQISRTEAVWVWWPFGGDAMETVKLRVARPGFDKHKEKVQWNPKTQSHVSLSAPIALTPKSASEMVKDLR